MENLAGVTFGRWTAVDLFGKDKHGAVMWNCTCQCGNSRPVLAASLIQGKSTSCGCFQKEWSSSKHKKHGHSHRSDRRHTTKEYNAWSAMKSRCYNKNYKFYDRYGGRGIRVCGKWRNNFSAFLSDVGPAPSRLHTLGRIDNDGNYEPGNVEWQDKQTQANNKCNNFVLDFRGERVTLPELARRFGIGYRTLRNRLTRMGWSAEKAVTTPLLHK